MRYRTGIFALLLACSCGGQPAGGKVPAANPAHVAGAAAAAAALITLADPDGARQRQEERGGEVNKDKTKKVNETVPEDVLFAPARSEEEASADTDKKLPPCKKTKAVSKDKDTGAPLELFPPVSEGTISTPKRCRETSEKDESNAGPGDKSKAPTGKGKER